MLRILLVDEDPASRRQAAELLRHFDYTVRTVGRPGAALATMQHGRFDAVLVSASLPQLTATAFVEALRCNQRSIDVPVVVMAVTPRTAVDAIRAGARSCIRKPLDVSAVVSAVRPVVKPRRARTTRRLASQ